MRSIQELINKFSENMTSLRLIESFENPQNLGNNYMLNHNQVNVHGD